MLRNVLTGTRLEPLAIQDAGPGNLHRLLWSRQTARDLASVSISWGLLVVCLTIGQAINFRLGVAPWPMGEDRVWIDILQNRGPLEAAKTFWQINDRNPLAPWWYIAIRPIVLRYDSGLFIIREAVGLLLAVTTYIFILAMAQVRLFALSIACVVAVFTANGYIDHIYWTMHVALICSFCSLILYKLFVDDSPGDYRLYISAVVAWFIAVGTYSIQIGAIVGIAILALLVPAPTLIGRLQRAATDVLPFVILFGIYWLEWQTTSRSTYLVRPRLLAGISSICQAFWHFDYLGFYNSVVYADRSNRLFFLASAFAIGCWVYYSVARTDHKTAQPCPLNRLVEATIVVICLTLPVAAVEATGYGIIGEAWRKVYQFTIPFIYLSVVAALFLLLPVASVRILWRAVVAVLAAVGAAVSLGINYIQVKVTQNEKALRAALGELAQENAAYGYTPPYYFLIKREPDFIWYSSDVLSPTYGRTWSFPPIIYFRFLPREDTSDPGLFIGFNERSVENAALDGNTISNGNVFLLSASAAGIRRLCRVGSDDVAFPLIEWKRSAELASTIGDCAESR